METYYRACDRNGWSKYDSLEHLDACLKRNMADGIAFWPIKRIVKVTSEDIPFTETARRYNDLVAATPHCSGTTWRKSIEMKIDTERRCDCCGKKFPIEPLYRCYNSIRYWDVYKTPPVNIWLICEHCLYSLETTMKAEVAKLRGKSHAEQSDAKDVNESNVMDGRR